MTLAEPEDYDMIRGVVVTGLVAGCILKLKAHKEQRKVVRGYQKTH